MLKLKQQLRDRRNGQQTQLDIRKNAMPEQTENKTLTLIDKAKQYASEAHEATNHKYDGKPYSYHLNMVADYASRFSKALITYLNWSDPVKFIWPEREIELAIAGAWVHDVIEDARQTFNDVKRATNEEVAEIAFALTNEKGKTRADRANEKYYEGLRKNPIAQYIKICDRLANITHAKEKHSRMLSKYRAEYVEFRQKLYEPEFDEMFALMEALLRESNTINIYGQVAPHDDLFIYGNKKALAALKEMLEVVLEGEDTHEATFSTTDGEDYRIVILHDDNPEPELMLPYEDSAYKNIGGKHPLSKYEKDEQGRWKKGKENG